MRLRIAIGYQLSFEYTYGIETKGLITVHGEFQPGLKGCYDYMTNCSTEKKQNHCARPSSLFSPGWNSVSIGFFSFRSFEPGPKMILPTLKKTGLEFPVLTNGLKKALVIGMKIFCPGWKLTWGFVVILFTRRQNNWKWENVSVEKGD